jgi:threonine dehydratase
MVETTPKTGPFGEAIYPKAKLDQKMEVMLRYHIRGKFSDVAAFYKDQYDGQKHLCIAETQSAGQKNFSIGVAPACETVGFGALVVMPMPDSKDDKDVWVLVLAK